MVVSRVTNGVVDDVACWMSEKKKKKQYESSVENRKIKRKRWSEREKARFLKERMRDTLE